MRPPRHPDGSENHDREGPTEDPTVFCGGGQERRSRASGGHQLHLWRARGLALLLFSGNAGASEEGKIIVVPPKQDDPPEDDPPEDYGSNWGVFPNSLKGPFLVAEKAARLPGLARFMAIWSWGAFRAKKPFVTPEKAADIAAKNPLLCSGCQNLDDGKYSREALEWVTKSIEEGGAYDPPWPAPEDYDAWADFGSAGLFDLLSGSSSALRRCRFSPRFRRSRECEDRKQGVHRHHHGGSRHRRLDR